MKPKCTPVTGLCGGSGKLTCVCWLLVSPFPETSAFNCCQRCCHWPCFLFLLLFQVNRSHVLPARWKNKWCPRVASSPCFSFNVTITKWTNIETVHIDTICFCNWLLLKLFCFYLLLRWKYTLWRPNSSKPVTFLPMKKLVQNWNSNYINVVGLGLFIAFFFFFFPGDFQ